MIETFWGGKWIILAGSLLVGGLAAWLSLQLPNQYTATALILIDPQGPQIVGLSTINKENPLNESLVESKAYLARSNRVVKAVVARLELDKDDQLIGEVDEAAARDIGLATEEFRTRLAMRAANEALTIRPVGTSFLIDIRAETYSPQLSADMANAFAAEFLNAELERKREATQFVNSWIFERLDELQERVTQSASTLETFRTRSGGVAERELTERSQMLELLQEQADAVEGDVPETLRQRIERMDRELREMTVIAVELRQLERQAEADQALYERLLARAGELQEIATFHATDIVIISEAMSPLIKSAPNRKLITLLGGILGGSIGVLIVVGRSMQRARWREVGR